MTGDHRAIRDLIENWVIWRDAGAWSRLATLWHPDGRMMTTWCEASASDFIARSEQAWQAGMTVLHSLGGTSIDQRADRAVAQTRMRILQRAEVHGVLVDVTCHGRFWDALERVDGRWLLRLRQPIYELDAMTPVALGAHVALDPVLLASFPEGYRNLAYLQTQLGLTVSRDLPGTRGSAVEALLDRGARWLAGDAPACLSGS